MRNPTRSLVLALHGEFEASYWTLRAIAQVQLKSGLELLERWWKQGRVEPFMVACQAEVAAAGLGEAARVLLVKNTERFLTKHQPKDLVALMDFWQKREVQLAGQGFHTLTWLDESYLNCLANLDEPPPILWYTGPFLRLMSTRRLAMIGSRQMTHYGEKAARFFASRLAGVYGLTVVSGCARGVDWQCQKAALDAGGRSLGVLGCGITQLSGKIRPYINKEQLVIVSEFSPYTGVAKWRFPQRNRLISALAEAVLVIEAGDKSGTSITAAAAADQGRQLYVLTQPYYSPNAVALRQLSLKGAAVIVTPEDVLEELDLPVPAKPPPENLLAQAQTEVEAIWLRGLASQGGRALADSIVFPQKVSEAEKISARMSLESRGIIRDRLGACELSCMIQS